MITPRMVNSFIWILVGVMGGQIVRLGGNLVLTRLLVPEMFGLMVLVNAAIMGMTMFSDVGIRGALINSKRAQDPAFCNTAWTLQVMRGCIIYLFILMLCAPIAQFYDQPVLAPMMLIAGLSVFVQSFIPIKVYYLIKEVDTKRISVIELVAQILGMMVLIGLAYEYRNVWALVWGSLAAMVFQVVGYYIFLPGGHNRFFWDFSAFREIFRYGRWIILSTGSLYLTLQGDRLIMGKFMSLEFIGIYGIAITFSMLLNEIAEKVSTQFLFPVYRKFTEMQPPRLDQVRRYRLVGVLFGIVASMPLLVGGQWLIDSLYDDRYEEAGWMLQILAVVGVVRLFDTVLRPLFLAMAKSFDSMIYQVIKGCLSVSLLICGVSVYGLEGFLIAMVLSPVVNLVVLHIMVRRFGYRWFLDDIPLLALVATLAYISWTLVDSSPLSHLPILT